MREFWAQIGFFIFIVLILNDAELKYCARLEYASKIPEYAISGVAAPFLRHKARLSAAKPSGFFLELTQNPLELADCSA